MIIRGFSVELGRAARFFAWAGVVSLALGCGSSSRPGKVAPIDLPQAEARPGTALVILVDTSSSMNGEVPDHEGKRRPKSQIARDALARIVKTTADWKRKNPDRHLDLAIYHFATRIAPVLPMGEFDADKAAEALKKIPKPEGNTAIGLAMEAGFRALYGSGRSRKFILCITDGENTEGPAPDRVARQLHDQTQGGVEMHFVAFDTSARAFGFLKFVNGHVVEANDGEQLQMELGRIYEKRILAEAEEPDPGS